MAVTTDKSSSLDVVLLAGLLGINHIVLSQLLERMVTTMGSGFLFALAMMPISAVLLFAFTRLQRRWDRTDALFYGIGTLAVGSLLYAIYFTFMRTPTAQIGAGGLAQKIFYF